MCESVLTLPVLNKDGQSNVVQHSDVRARVHLGALLRKLLSETLPPPVRCAKGMLSPRFAVGDDNGGRSRKPGKKAASERGDFASPCAPKTGLLLCLPCWRRFQNDVLLQSQKVSEQAVGPTMLLAALARNPAVDLGKIQDCFKLSEDAAHLGGGRGIDSMACNSV